MECLPYKKADLQARQFHSGFPGAPGLQWVFLRGVILQGPPTTGRPATRAPSWFTPTLGGPHVPCGRGSGSDDRVKGPCKGPCVGAVYQDQGMSATGELGKEVSQSLLNMESPNNIKALPTLGIPCSHGVPSQKWGSVCSSRGEHGAWSRQSWFMETVLVVGPRFCVVFSDLCVFMVNK